MTWLGDVVNAIVAPAKSIDMDNAVSRKVASAALTLAMELCWCGKVKARVKEFTRWSGVRCDVNAMISRAHENRFLENAASSTQDPEILAKKLLEAMHSAPDPMSSLDDRLQTIIAGPNFDGLRKFLSENNLDMPARTHKANFALMQATLTTLSWVPDGA